MCSQIEKSCYNQNENIKRKIRNSLGLKENECIIEEGGKNTYTIKPIAGEKELRISTIKSVYNGGLKIYLFQLCNLIFEHCIFKCEIELKEIDKTIDNKINFNDCTFQRFFRCTDIKFMKNIVFNSSIFETIVSFNKVTFNSEASFSNCVFQSEVNFSNSIFSQEVNFKQAIFKASAYFDNATFSSNADFERSEFYKNAHFYQTKFIDDPNFFQTTFNEHLNLTDTKIHNEVPNIANTPIFNFNFEGLKEKVQTCSEADKFRDVFKNIKNALIKSGNLLGASRFRKMELYCKEIELDLKKKENRETSTRDFVDRIQLMFYRFTSDHHTDLLLILNNVFGLIALFAITAFLLCCFASYDTKWVDYECCTSTEAYYLYSLMTNSFCVDCNMGNLAWLEICFILALCLTFAIAFILMVAMFYCINTKCKHLGRWFIVIFFVNAFILAIKPAIMLPLFGKLIDENLKVDFPAFTSLSIVYAILMFLLIFSLQKTARKNTIVPN